MDTHVISSPSTTANPQRPAAAARSALAPGSTDANPQCPTASTARSPPAYSGGVAYWDTRHLEDAADRRKFDWLFDYAQLRSLLRSYVARDAAVLQLGCGNSRLALEWCADGHRGVLTNLDFSPSVIAQMRAELPRDPRYAQLSYAVADVRCLGEADFPSGSFDAVLDKATFDGMACNARSVSVPATGSGASPDTSGTDDLESMLLSAFRVLRPGGVYILISCGDPPSRLPWLENEPGLDWRVSVSYMHIRSEAETNANFAAEDEGETDGAGTDAPCVAETSVRTATAVLSVPCAVSPPVIITGNADWEEELRGVSEDAHTFVYVCRKAI